MLLDHGVAVLLEDPHGKEVDKYEKFPVCYELKDIPKFDSSIKFKIEREIYDTFTDAAARFEMKQ